MNLQALKKSSLQTFRCPFLLLYGLCESLPSHPPCPSTPPSLALSDSVLIEAIKPPHLVREEILIFIRLMEELGFFSSSLPSPLRLPP